MDSTGSRTRDEDDLEVEHIAEKEQNGDTLSYYKVEIVEEIKIEASYHKHKSSVPPVGKLLQALGRNVQAIDSDLTDSTTGGDVNDTFQHHPHAQSIDEGLASGSDILASEADDVVKTKSDESEPQNEIAEIPLTKDVKFDFKIGHSLKHILDSLDPEKNQKSYQNKELPTGSDRVELVNGNKHLNFQDQTDTHEMENQIYISPELEVPFTKSQVQRVELSNINGLLKSLQKNPKPANQPGTPPPNSPCKVTDEEVDDALRFLLGKGGCVSRARSAMDLRTKNAKKRGGTTTSFVVIMLPDGTHRKISVARRPSLGNPDDLIDEAIPDRFPKLQKNEFDGREERPPTPASTSSDASSTCAENAVDIKTNPGFPESPSLHFQSYPNPILNSIEYPNVNVNDSLIDQNKHVADSDDLIVPTSYIPDENNFDFSIFERLSPVGETEPELNLKSSELMHTNTTNVTVADLAELMPIFDSEKSECGVKDLTKHQLPLIEIDIQTSVTVIPEELYLDFSILDKKELEFVTYNETRNQSGSDASSRSTEWQEATIDLETEDEIVPDFKTPTETVPDLKILRPTGMEALGLEHNKAMSLEQLQVHHTDRNHYTVTDLKDMVPAFDILNFPLDKDKGFVNKPLVEEDIFNAVTLSPEENQVNIFRLNKLDPDADNSAGGDTRPYDISDILDLSSEEEDWPAPPETSAKTIWPATPVNMYDLGIPMVGDLYAKNEEDLPPPPLITDNITSTPNNNKISSPSRENSLDIESPISPNANTSLHDTPTSITLLENRFPSFVPIETPKRSKSQENLTDSLFNYKIDDDSKQPEVTEPSAVVVTLPSGSSTVDLDALKHINESDNDVVVEQDQKSAEHQESSVDPQRFWQIPDDSSGDEGTSVDVITTSPKEKKAIVSITYKPNESTLNISNPLDRRDSHNETMPSKKERAKVSNLEELIPKFDSASDSDNDEEQSGIPVIEDDLCISAAVCPEESCVSLSELDHNLRFSVEEMNINNSKKLNISTDYQEETLDFDTLKHDQSQPNGDLNFEPIPEKESELSTESQEITINFDDTEHEDKLFPISHIPVESRPDLMELERKYRPPGTKSPEAVSDTEFMPDNQSSTSTDAITDLIYLIPTFDSTSESGESESRESTSPVDETIEEIGCVSPTRTVFNFELLESLVPTKEINGLSPEEYATRKSQEILVESYMSVFREERVLELLNTCSSSASAVNGLDESTSEDDNLPEIVIKERTSSSSSAESESSLGSKITNDANLNGTRPVVEPNATYSPSKRKPIGQQQGDDNDEEIPAKKPKFFDILEKQPDISETIIIEAGISVFREDSIVEGVPTIAEAKPSTIEYKEIKDDEEWPAPPPPEILIQEEWPSPPERLEEFQTRDVESEDVDTEDTSSVSTSSTEGEYVPEQSLTGVDRVFALTVIPQLEIFNEEDEQSETESEDIQEKTEIIKKPRFAISTERIPVQSESTFSISSESGAESSFANDENTQTISTNNQDIPIELEPQISFSIVQPIEAVPCETAEVQPGIFQPSILEKEIIYSNETHSKTNDSETDVHDLETELTYIGNEYDKSKKSVSDFSYTGNVSSIHSRIQMHDEDILDSMTNETTLAKDLEDAIINAKFEPPNDDEEEDKNGQENIEYPPTYDSETDSESTDSSDGLEGVFFSPTGSRVFILTGLPGFSVPDDVCDVHESKTSQGEVDVAPSDLKHYQHGEPMPELIPVTTPPTENIPDIVQETPVEPVEILESAPVIAGRTGSESDSDTGNPSDDTVVVADIHSCNIPSSSETCLEIASDAFLSPTTDTPAHQMLSPDIDEVSKEPVALVRPRDILYEQEPATASDHEEVRQDQVVDWHEPEENTFHKNTYSDPQLNYEIQPSPPETCDLSSPPNNNRSSPPSITESKYSPPSDNNSVMESSGHGPSFSHYIPTSKQIPNLSPRIPSSDSINNSTDDSSRGSDTEIAYFTSNRPKGTEFIDPVLPNLAPYTSSSRTTDSTNPASFYQPSPRSIDIVNPLVKSTFDSDIVRTITTDLNEPGTEPFLPNAQESLYTDSIDPAVPTITSQRPWQRSPFEPMHMETSPMKFGNAKETDINDPAVYNLVPEMSTFKETDITDPATFYATDIVVPAPASTFVSGKLPSTNTDIIDAAVPVFRYESQTLFEPIDSIASPMPFETTRPKTPIETETSLVPPDVYTDDEAYEQFQVQYRGNLNTETPQSQQKRHKEKAKKTAQIASVPSYMAPPVHVQNNAVKSKGKKVPPPIPPRFESGPLLQEPNSLESKSTDIVEPAYLEPKRYTHNEPDVSMSDQRLQSMDTDAPPLPYQSMFGSTGIIDPLLSHDTKPTSMKEFSLSHSSKSRYTDINDPEITYPIRSRSTDFLSAPVPFPVLDRPKHAKSVDISAPSIPHQPRSRSIDFTAPDASHWSGPRSSDVHNPGLYLSSKSTDITDPTFESPLPRSIKAAPQYLVPSRGPVPDVNKPPLSMSKDIELESLKNQLRRLGTKMGHTRQELERLKRNNPANRYASPVDRSAHSRGSSRSSIDSPDVDVSDLRFSRKFFASLTDKEFGKMLEEMRLYRMAVREKGVDMKRLSKQCEGIRLRLKQLGEPFHIPDANINMRVGGIETTI